MHAPKSGLGSTTSIRLRFDRLVAYSTNQLPLNMAALPVVLNVSHFYGEVLKVPLGIMGLIFITTRVIDAVQDPVIGLISDKFTHRGPRGRLTFVALMLPLLIGGFYMLFHPPEAAVHPARAGWRPGCSSRSSWSISAMPASRSAITPTGRS